MSNTALTAITVLGGLLSAALSIMYLFPIPGLIFFSYLTTLPLFLMGFSIGLRPLYGAGLIATAIVALLEGPIIGGEFFVFSFLGPAFLVGRALLNRTKKTGEVVWYPSSLLLRDLTLASGIVMLIALGAYLYFTQGGDADNILKPALKAFDPHEQLKDAEPLLHIILPILPGFFAFSWSLMMLFNAFLAQGLLIRFKKNTRPTPTFLGLDMPMGFLIIFGISIVLSFVGVGSLEILGKNGSIVLSFPFFLIGLSFVHFLLNRTPYSKIGLTIFYVFLLLFIWPLLLVILLGILKPLIEKSFSTN